MQQMASDSYTVHFTDLHCQSTSLKTG